MVTRLDRLRLLADSLEQRIATASDKEASALAGQLLKALEQIDQIERQVPKAGSAVDEISQRRKARRKPIKDGKAREA